MTKGSKFDDFLKDENIEIDEKIIKEIAELKAENERLKKEIRLYDCIEKWGTKQCRCACRCLGNEFCEDADKRIDKYKKPLQEIKEIAEQSNVDCIYRISVIRKILTKAESEG